MAMAASFAVLAPIVAIVTTAVLVMVAVTPVKAVPVAALPAIDIEELVPGDSQVSPQRTAACSIDGTRSGIAASG